MKTGIEHVIDDYQQEHYFNAYVELVTLAYTLKTPTTDLTQISQNGFLHDIVLEIVQEESFHDIHGLEERVALLFSELGLDKPKPLTGDDFDIFVFNSSQVADWIERNKCTDHSEVLAHVEHIFRTESSEWVDPLMFYCVDLRAKFLGNRIMELTGYKTELSHTTFTTAYNKATKEFSVLLENHINTYVIPYLRSRGITVIESKTKPLRKLKKKSYIE